MLEKLILYSFFFVRLHNVFHVFYHLPVKIYLNLRICSMCCILFLIPYVFIQKKCCHFSLLIPIWKRIHIFYLYQIYLVFFFNRKLLCHDLRLQYMPCLSLCTIGPYCYSFVYIFHSFHIFFLYSTVFPFFPCVIFFYF